MKRASETRKTRQSFHFQLRFTWKGLCNNEMLRLHGCFFREEGGMRMRWWRRTNTSNLLSFSWFVQLKPEQESLVRITTETARNLIENFVSLHLIRFDRSETFASTYLLFSRRHFVGVTYMTTFLLIAFLLFSLLLSFFFFLFSRCMAKSRLRFKLA